MKTLKRALTGLLTVSFILSSVFSPYCATHATETLCQEKNPPVAADNVLLGESEEIAKDELGTQETSSDECLSDKNIDDSKSEEQDSAISKEQTEPLQLKDINEGIICENHLQIDYEINKYVVGDIQYYQYDSKGNILSSQLFTDKSINKNEVYSTFDYKTIELNSNVYSITYELRLVDPDGNKIETGSRTVIIEEARKKDYISWLENKILQINGNISKESTSKGLPNESAVLQENSEENTTNIEDNTSQINENSKIT